MSGSTLVEELGRAVAKRFDTDAPVSADEKGLREAAGVTDRRGTGLLMRCAVEVSLTHGVDEPMR